MRILLSAILAVLGMSAAFADGPQEEHVDRVMQHFTVTEGTVIDWPDCLEGERGGIVVQPVYYVGNMRIDRIDNTAGAANWTFHIVAYYEDGKQVVGDALKQIQLQGYTYCTKRKN